MKQHLSEKNLVIALFVAALVIFAFAQEDSRKIEKRLLDITHALPQPVDSPATLANTQVLKD